MDLTQHNPSHLVHVEAAFAVVVLLLLHQIIKNATPAPRNDLRCEHGTKGRDGREKDQALDQKWRAMQA